MAGGKMDSSRGSKLTELQRLVLRSFFEREHSFYLTGGAALAGYHLGHRETDDLDLFTLDPSAFERARHVLADVASSIGAKLEIVQNAPGYVRATLAASQTADALVVDLVREHTFQIHPTKPLIDGIAVDPADEILANKLTTLVGRAEERDLVDVLALERTGLKVEDHLAAAAQKDGGCTPATLAWLLSEISIPDGIQLPAGVTATELRDYVQDLIKRLRRAALPQP
jgi:predicted nucleotidyltransferase component of viral defense system